MEVELKPHKSQIFQFFFSIPNPKKTQDIQTYFFETDSWFILGISKKVESWEKIAE